MKQTSSGDSLTGNRAICSIRAKMDEYMARLRLPGDWHTAAYAFLQSIYNKSGSDQSLYGYHGILVQFFLHGKHPNEITKNDVLEFLNQPSKHPRNKGQPVAANTSNGKLCVIASFYKFCSTWIVEGQPLYSKALPTLGIAYAKPAIHYKAMSADDIKAFFAVIPETVKGARDRALFLTYLYTARRKSEILRLRVTDLSRSSLIDTDGTPRDCMVYEFQSKGKSRETQRAELPGPCWAAIQQYWKVAGRGERPPEEEPVFASLRPGVVWTGKVGIHLCGDYVNLVFKAYCAKAGLSDTLSIHSLRHSSARERYNAGQGVLDIQRLLGHSSLGTTQNYLFRLSGLSDPGAALLEQRLGKLGASG